MSSSPPDQTPAGTEIGGRYARYALGVLMLVYVFNFLDRQIISILAEQIRADLGLTDAEIGFLGPLHRFNFCHAQTGSVAQTCFEVQGLASRLVLLLGEHLVGAIEAMPLNRFGRNRLHVADAIVLHATFDEQVEPDRAGRAHTGQRPQFRQGSTSEQA